MSLKSFLPENKIGLLIRGFATKPEQVPDRVAMMEKIVAKATSITFGGLPVIRRVDILIWADKRNYPGMVDCGELAPVLRQQFKQLPTGVNVIVHEVEHGDLFCALLNYGVTKQMESGFKWSMIVSSEADSYLTPETLTEMIKAADSGAKVVGVAINELTESVLQGRIANTFAMWNGCNLMTVGGFDLRAAKPIDDKRAFYLHGWSAEKNSDVFYQLAGVEEMIPLARMVETFGPCIAPIVPSGEGIQQYVIPDPVKDRDLYLRHISKMGTKLQRQSAFLAMIGKDLSYLEGGVLPAYRIAR